MLHAYTLDVTIPWSVYERIRREIGRELPPGLLVHLVLETDAGLRYLDVWESKETCDRFFSERVHPAIAAVLARAGRSLPPGEPERTPIVVKEIWGGRQLLDGKVE